MATSVAEISYRDSYLAEGKTHAVYRYRGERLPMWFPLMNTEARRARRTGKLHGNRAVFVRAKPDPISDPRTLGALNRSIKKWSAIVAGKADDGGWKTCPLCALFYEDGCFKCPVANWTGRRLCIATPYYRWVDAWKSEFGDLTGIYPPVPGVDKGVVIGPRSMAAAIDELAFLSSLLRPVAA